MPCPSEDLIDKTQNITTSHSAVHINAEHHKNAAHAITQTDEGIFAVQQAIGYLLDSGHHDDSTSIASDNSSSSTDMER